jgi:hypothetical protein
VRDEAGLGAEKLLIPGSGGGIVSNTNPGEEVDHRTDRRHRATILTKEIARRHLPVGSPVAPSAPLNPHGGSDWRRCHWLRPMTLAGSNRSHGASESGTAASGTTASAPAKVA